MKKVLQSIIDKDHGDCMRAVWASILEIPLMEFPDLNGDDWFHIEYNYLRERWYCSTSIMKGKHDTEMLKKIARFDNGVNGFLYASVPSQTFPNVTHAVVVDTDLNIVHDPNPNQKALLLKPEDVLGIVVMHDMRIGKTGKLFTIKEWEEASQEERDINTYKIGDK